MNSIDGKRTLTGRIFHSLAGGASLLLSWFAVFTPAAAGAEAVHGFHVFFPKKATAGGPVKIHVRLPSEPGSHAFNRLQVDLDGQPVAMADMSEERSSWITLEPLAPGVHKITVIWRNPPQGSPVSRSASITVLQEKPSIPANPAGSGVH